METAPEPTAGTHGQMSEDASACGQAPVHEPKCFIIVHNISKRHNIGTLARSASAFGVAEVCLVGSRQFNAFGSHGATEHVAFRHFPTLEECCKALREQEGCDIVGVEITDGAQPVHERPFKGPTAFMIGNEGQGLSPRQMALCDSFVYITQYGSGTASLNVTVATTVVLHHFALWAGYHEHSRDGFKYVVGPKPQRTHSRGMVARTPEEAAAEQKRRQQRRDAASAVEAVLEGSDDAGGYSLNQTTLQNGTLSASPALDSGAADGTCMPTRGDTAAMLHT